MPIRSWRNRGSKRIPALLRAHKLCGFKLRTAMPPRDGLPRRPQREMESETWGQAFPILSGQAQRGRGTLGPGLAWLTAPPSPTWRLPSCSGEGGSGYPACFWGRVGRGRGLRSTKCQAHAGGSTSWSTWSLKTMQDGNQEIDALRSRGEEEVGRERRKRRGEKEKKYIT